MAKSSIRRIIRLETTPEGATVPVELYARPRGGKKKKTERTLRPLRRAQRHLLGRRRRGIKHRRRLRKE